jgi:hypothetical protein
MWYGFMLRFSLTILHVDDAEIPVCREHLLMDFGDLVM